MSWDFLNSVSDNGESIWESGLSKLGSYADQVIENEIDQKYSADERPVVTTPTGTPVAKAGGAAPVYNPPPVGQNLNNIMVGNIPLNKTALYIGLGAGALAIILLVTRR